MNRRKRILALSFLLNTTFTQASPDEEAISALRDVIEKQYKNLVTCDGNQYAIYYTVNAWESRFDSTRGRVPGFPAILEVKGGKWIAIPTELTEADKLNGIEWKGTAGFQITAIRWYPLPGRIETRQEKPGWSEWKNPLDTLTAKMQNRKQYWLFAAHMAKKSASASPWEFELIDGLSKTKGITCDDVKKFAGVSETTPSTQRQTSPGPIEHKQENFIWPIEVPTFSGNPPNDYATFGVGKKGYFHAGVDIKSSNLPLDKTRVKAIANGIIEDIFRTTDTTTRCDGVTPFAIRTDNHGFGNTIILKHSDKLYSLYAHLHCVESKLEKGTSVSQGEPIGLMGNSAYEKRECNPESDCNPESTEDRGFGKHLHLEIKKTGILTHPDGPAGKYFAYTKDHPDKYGYLDPKEIIGPWPSTAAARPSPATTDPAIAGCAVINDRDYSVYVTLVGSRQNHLNRGQERDGYSFSKDGSLTYQGQLVAHNIPVSGSSSSEGDRWIYAQSVALSPKSPSGRFAILQACDEPDFQGMCWALFVVDHSRKGTERTSAGKYGGELIAWVQAGDEYAVFRYRSEGSTTHYRVHLPTSKSDQCSEWIRDQ